MEKFDAKPGNISHKAYTWLMLLQSEIISVKISFEDYTNSVGSVNRFKGIPSTNPNWDRMFHYAKGFALSIRRVAKLLEKAELGNNVFPGPMRNQIKCQWKINCSFFNDYKSVRDDVEHIDERIDGKKRKYSNLWGNSFESTDGNTVPITKEAVDKIEKIWASICQSTKPSDTCLASGMEARET